MTSRVDMIIETLKNNKDRKFSARDLAIEFIKEYPFEMQEKRKNPKYANEEQLIAQLAAEIGGKRTFAEKKCSNVATKDTPRPRIYYWENSPEKKNLEEENLNNIEDNTEENDELEGLINSSIGDNNELSEYDTYPILMKYLQKDLDLLTIRIDDKKSKNTQGSGGNHWLHPDIVALEPIDKKWDDSVRSCVRHGNQTSIRLWSFEVKKRLTKGNVRKSFFQAVSNSSWANFGYLVATDIDDGVESELQMLCSLHGIGVLLLNTGSLFDSQILIPAKEKDKIDWLSVNRIVTENSDFHNYIHQVSIYCQTGSIIKTAWGM